MRLGVYGTGAFGTGLAIAYYKAGFNVHWLCYDEQEAKIINGGQNILSVSLPQGLALHADNSFSDLDVLLWATPSQVIQSALQSITLPPHLPLVLCSKGLINQRFLHEIAAEILPNPILALSGPTFALEIAQGLPAEGVLASFDKTLAKDLAQKLSHPHFSLTVSEDIIGVEICGALKNVYAIGAGMVIGSNLGTNAHAAFLTHALEEMIIIGKHLGAQEETFLTVAGIGDLLLTGSQMLSRNMTFGMALAKGQRAEAILKERHAVTEGVEAAKNIYLLVHELNVPIFKKIYEKLN